MPDQRDAERLLTQTRREIAAWRRKHARGRMPNRFWVQAAEAAAQLGLDQVASRCELDPERLRRWMQELELDLPATATAAKPFVELSPLSLTPASECELELESEPGSKLRIRLSGPAIERAESLAATLWRLSR